MRTKISMFVLLMGISAVLLAQPEAVVPKKYHQQQQGFQREQIHNGIQALKLTDGQRESFKKGMLATQKQLQPLRNQLGEARAHQRTLNTAEKPDMGAINKNIERIGEIRTEMEKIQTRNHLEMRAQLTEEQRLKFDMLRGKMLHGKGPKGEKGPKGPKGMK